jgi:hypothetical protein
MGVAYNRALIGMCFVPLMDKQLRYVFALLVYGLGYNYVTYSGVVTRKR